MEKIALLPGGFKPPHAGHYNMAIWLAENTDADTVIIKIGAKERDGITREISLKLWNLYRNNDTNESSRKLTILPSDSNSPVQDVYDFIENKAPKGSIIYLGMGEKDINDSRFNNIPKFADPKNIKFETTLVPPQAGGVSGTKMRDFIKTGDKTSFQNFIPSFLSKEQKDQAWELVSSLSEDFYDPRNKFYDFAKSNDPGPKDDIEPSYKYKRGGVYGRMYEVEQEMEELMMGMMTEPEKKKHAKNLKRLKKDTAKQGDQYMEVPDYLKGTLTRKLYEEEDLSHYATSAASVNDITIPLEIMDTPEKQITGMMDRDELKGGMVFPYNQVSKKNFHMEGCKIPLDIIFINQGKIDKIHHSCPPCKQTPCPQYSGLADNVIELEGGYCKKHGIKEGDEVNLNLIHQDNKVKYTLKEKLDKKDIKQIDTFADKQLDPVDVDLTSDHFFDRLNDPRNDKEISNAELIGFFKRLAKKKKDLLNFLSKYKEIVASDSRTDINIPFLKQADKIIAKTILRKKDFQTSSPQLALERDLSGKEERIAQSLPDKEFKKRYGKDWKAVKIATATKMAKNEGDTYEKMAAKGKKKTQRMKKEATFTKAWWKEIINEVLLTEGGAAGHMAHPFNLPNVNNGKQLLDVFKKSADSLDKNPGAVKIDGVNSSIRLIDVDGKKQFVMDRGSKKPLDLKGITKDDLLDRFGKGHGMVKIGGEVLDMFNEALPAIQNDLKKLGAFDDPNILFNMEYVSGKTNVQDYGSNFIAIHGLNKIESKEVQGKRGPLTKRISSEVSYSKDDLQSLLDNLAPVAKKKDFEVYGSVPTNMTKKPNFNAALSKKYTVEAGENTQTKSLGEWLNTLSNIPEEEFIFMNVDYEKDSSTVNRKKVGAVSKQVYLAILNGENVDGLFDDEKDREKAIQGFITYLATEKLGDEVLKVLDSPMGSVENHEGVVIRDENIANVPFKITGKFILGGLVSDF